MEFLLFFILVTAFSPDNSSKESSKSPDLEGEQKCLEEFNKVFVRYRAQIVHHIQSRLGQGNDDWQDVFQATIVAIFQGLQKDQFDRSKGNMGSFIYGITKNKISDHFSVRRRRRESDLPEEEMEMEQLIDNYTAEFTVVQEEAHQKLKNCLRKLPERYSSVLRLRYFEELSMREISRKLKRTEQQVIDLHRYGLVKLRDCFFKEIED